MTRDEYLASVRKQAAIEPCSPETLRDFASMWDNSAEWCEEKNYPEFAERDRRIASAMRYAADILEKQLCP